MSGVAQRAGRVDIGAAAAVSRWEGTGRADYASGISASPPATISGQYGREDKTPPPCHNIWSIWQERYCHPHIMPVPVVLCIPVNNPGHVLPLNWHRLALRT